MVWRISAAVGPPVRLAAVVVEVGRRGGSARSWGARLACRTRRGSPLAPSGPAGSTGSGPVWRDSSQGGPDASEARGEATGIIGVLGAALTSEPGTPGPGEPGPGEPGPGEPGPGEPPARVWPVHPEEGAGGVPVGAVPAPGNRAAPA